MTNSSYQLSYSAIYLTRSMHNNIMKDIHIGFKNSIFGENKTIFSDGLTENIEFEKILIVKIEYN